MLYLYINEAIVSYILKALKNFKVENKLLCIITDNDSNIKVVINILNQN